MKTKLIIINWLLSLSLLPSDNVIQSLIALAWFAGASVLLMANKAEVFRDMDRFNKWIDRVLTNK